MFFSYFFRSVYATCDIDDGNLNDQLSTKSGELFGNMSSICSLTKDSQTQIRKAVDEILNFPKMQDLMNGVEDLNMKVPLLEKVDQDLMNAKENAKKWNTTVSCSHPLQKFSFFANI
jgi:uncharacterized protein YaaN involved in tellurite resistance